MYLSRGKKIIIAVLITILLLGGVLFSVNVRRTAGAGLTVFSPAEFAEMVREFFTEGYKEALTEVALSALDKAATKFINDLAERTGDFIATGGKGGSPLKRRESFGSIIRKSGEAALGDFVQDLSSIEGGSGVSLNSLGLNLCNPTAQLKLNISLQILDEERPQEPSGCDINEIKENWKRFQSDFADPSNANLNIRRGDEFAIGAGVTKGRCETKGESGQCVFPGQQPGQSIGVCGSGSSTSGTSVTQRDFCSTDADCLAGDFCIEFAFVCLSDAECTEPGTVCSLDAGRECLDDSECSVGNKCIGARKNSNSGIPWISLTAEQSFQERLDTFNNLFSPETSDLGAFILLSSKEKELREARKKYAQITAEQCEDYKSKGLAVTDEYVAQNCAEIAKLDANAGEASLKAAEERAYKAAGGSGGGFASASFWKNAAKHFGRSLLSGLLKKYIRAGSFSLADLQSGPNLSQVRENVIQQLRGGVTSPLGALVQNDLVQLRRPSLTIINEFDYLSNFVVCPNNRNNVELDNCTIDNDFASAIREKTTVQDAIDDGLLRGDLPLISNLNFGLNSDPYCIRSGYCHSNIVRLRKYRVVPVGWEIAASLSPVDDPITLAEAIACFDNSPGCPLDLQANVYYHLMDPSWVLKAPETQCRAFGLGPKLVDINIGERQEYCADPISCLAEDDIGNCVGGFGYCTKEKKIWRFDGNRCPEQFASCNLYTRTHDKNSFAYLGNTLDVCDASENGCLWYSLSQDNVGSVTEPVYAWNPDDRIYMNINVQECELDQAGCTEYISLLTPGVNVVPNGDFDFFTANVATNFSDPDWLNDDLPDTLDGWQGNAVPLTTGDNSFYGTIGLRLHVDPPSFPVGRLSTNVTTGILADKPFVLTWQGKAASDCTTDVSITTPSTPAISVDVDFTSEWKQYELLTTYDVNNLDTSATISFSNDCIDTGGVKHDMYIDGVKFALNSSASGFTQYADNGRVYGLSQFQCTKEDVGCDTYKPVAGGPSVPGRIDSDDACPAECVGYQSYLELPSKFDVQEAAPAVPLAQSKDLIAATGSSCPASQVDCEEFTNLEEVAQGGEGRHYFKFIRQCVEDAFGVTYYTLEGSDTTGYQVRTWRLLESGYIPGLGVPPCANVDMATSNCIDDVSNTAATTCSAAELQTNLDCREFFDLDGNPHYILQSRVIAASSDCLAYRRTLTGVTFFALESESLTCEIKNNGCREYRGNQANNLRVLFDDAFEGGTIKPWSSLTASISSEAVTTGGHSMTNVSASGSVTDNMSRSEGSKFLIDNEKELYMDFWMKNDTPVNVTPAVAPGVLFDTLNVPVTSDWQLYRLGPLFVNASATFIQSPNIGVSLPPGGRGVCQDDQSKNCTAATEIAACGALNTCKPLVYLDNVVYKEAISDVFLIRDSWITPDSCDQPVPGAMLGCQTYTKSNGTLHNLRSFSKLCSLDVIGCQAFIDTQNSTDPFQRIYNEDDPSEILVPQDEIQYFVFNEDNQCFSQSKGCSVIGKPKINRDLPEGHPKYINGYSVETLINDPDTYGSTLCLAEGLFCEEYTKSNGSNVYFKDPLDRVCAYKENINVQGQLFTGWFQVKSLATGETPVGCYDDGVLPYTESEFRIRPNLAADYDKWVGQCSSTYDRCTEFKDPQDTQGDNVLDDGDFELGPSTSVWKAYRQFGNSLTNLPGNGGQTDLFEVFGAGVSRSNPKGTARLVQIFDSFENTDIFSMSVDVFIQSLPDDPDNRIFFDLQCNWDSFTDVDVCRSSAGFDYSAPCVDGQATDCSFLYGLPGGYNCNGIDLSYCIDDLGNKTNIPCRIDTDCTDLPGPAPNGAGLPAGSACEVFGYNRPYLDRDQTIHYITRADPTIIQQWQTLQQSVDLGYDGIGRELIDCSFQLNTHRGVYDTGNTRADGLACGSPPSGNGDAVRAECNDTYCVDANGKADAVPDTCITPNCSVLGLPCGSDLEITACNLAGGVCNDSAGICPNPLFPFCGGTAEVWWSHAVFKKAKGYYYIDDEQIDSSSCAGQVSQKEGCLLFLDTGERQTKLFDSIETYELSTANNGEFVNPVSTGQNDSNRIIHVLRDRECTEWLSCRSATEVFDTGTNTFRQVCDQIGTCNEYQSGLDVLNCKNWVKPSKQRLEYGFYVNRSFDIDAVDYTGFSIYNNYPVGTLDIVDVSNISITDPFQPDGPDGRHPDYRMVRVIDKCDSGIVYEGPCGPQDPFSGAFLGRCFAPNKCVVGIDGSAFDRESDFVIPHTARAYAEKDSPFPNSVVESEIGGIREVKYGFQQANICDSTRASCEDRYFKFKYGSTGSNIVKYYSSATAQSLTQIPSCLCQGGQQDGKECLTDDIEGRLGCTNNLARSCSNDDDCGSGNRCVDTGDGKIGPDERCPDGGQPLFMSRAETFTNLPGYCLEPDKRANINASQDENACLTWLPVDNSPTGFDFFNQNREAGYAYKTPAFYCAEVGLYETRTNYYFGKKCSVRCTDSHRGTRAGYHLELRGRFGSNCRGLHRYTHCWAYPDGGEGIYSWDGNTVYNETEPDPSCVVLAQAVDERGENAAKTNLFWSEYPQGTGDGYTIGKDRLVTDFTAAGLPEPAPLGYKLDEPGLSDDPPFGSAVPTGFGLVTDVNLTIKNPKVIPRAGSPYACSSNKASCAFFDEDSNVQTAVPGWKKVPPFAGDETYEIGIIRLKEIYKKIFNVYRWRVGDLCNDTICGPSTISSNPGSVTSSYFGGNLCDPSDSNSCNSVAGVVSCAIVEDVCVNSVFNSPDPTSPLYRGCVKCEPGMQTEQRSSKRCESELAFVSSNTTTTQDLTGDGIVDIADCDSSSADFDPGPPVKDCAAYGPGYACDADPAAPSVFRCYGPDHGGNDCKIPYDINSRQKSLIPDELECEQNAFLEFTCHYAGEDTTVACETKDDCVDDLRDRDLVRDRDLDRDRGGDEDLGGLLHESNRSSYCADSFSEGGHDFGQGSFCVGEPFTLGKGTCQFSAQTICNIDDDCNNVGGGFCVHPLVMDSLQPVDCRSTSTFTNALGHVITGSELCKNLGSCVGEDQVKYGGTHPQAGDSVCVREPEGYLPMCIGDPVGNCIGVSLDRIIDPNTVFPSQVLPLDDTWREEPTLTPYMIAVECDASGVNCKQVTPTSNFNVPDHPTAGVLNDNSFSVNNTVSGVLDGFQNFLVSLKFYMSADKNHMPVRYIDVDWGDGSRQARVGYYKNHMDSCGDPQLFGPKTAETGLLEYAATDRACREGFRNYLHVYNYDTSFACGICSNAPPGPVIECSRNEDCYFYPNDDYGPCTPGPGSTPNASCYVPRVMLQDNWGWCTNGVYGETGLGCLDPDIDINGLPGGVPAPITEHDGYVRSRVLIKVHRDPAP